MPPICCFLMMRLDRGMVREDVDCAALAASMPTSHVAGAGAVPKFATSDAAQTACLCWQALLCFHVVDVAV